MLRVGSPADRRSWGILEGRGIDEEPVDRAAGVEIAEDAIPTPAWTAHRTRRPHRPTGVLGLTKSRRHVKMTRVTTRGEAHKTHCRPSLRSDE